MDNQSPTESLGDLGIVHGTCPLNEAVAQLSVSSDIIGRGLQAAIDRNSTSSFTTASSAEDSEVSKTNITLTSQEFSNEPLGTNRSNTTAAILSKGPNPITIGVSVGNSKETPPLPTQVPVSQFSDIPPSKFKLTTPKLVLPTKLPSAAEPPTPSETGEQQSPRMRGKDVNKGAPLPPAHDNPILPDSFPPPSGIITSESDGDSNHITINSTMESTFDGFVTLPDGTHRPSKADSKADSTVESTVPQYVHTSTPRPLPHPKESAGSLQHVYPNAIGLTLDFAQSKILPESPVTPVMLPQRVAKRKRGTRQSTNSDLTHTQSDQIIITQTVPSDSSEDTIIHLDKAKPVGTDKPTCPDPSDLIKSQIAEVSMRDPTQSSPGSGDELSKLIAALTHIGPIGQNPKPNPEPKASSDPPPDLVDLSTDFSHMELDPSRQPQPLLSTKSSAVWPTPSEATASWFDDIVADRAINSSLIASTQTNPPKETSKRVKISEQLPSDQNLKIIRDFHHESNAPPNTRSVSLPQPETKKEEDRPPHSRLDLPYLLEKEWRGVRSRLIQGNKTKARAIHLAELCQSDPISGDPPALTLWAMGLEQPPDFVMEDADLQNLVATHRRESALELQSKIAIALHERADAQLKLAHTTLAQTQKMAETNNVEDFSQALDVMAKLVGREKAAIKNQLRKRRPVLQQRQPTKLDWINFHNFSAAFARSQNKSATDNPRRQFKPDGTSELGPGPTSTVPSALTRNELKDFTIPKISRGRQKPSKPMNVKHPTPTAGTSNQRKKSSEKTVAPPTKKNFPSRKRSRSRSRNREQGGNRDGDLLAPSTYKRQAALPPPPHSGNNMFQGHQMQPFLHQMPNMPFYFPNPYMFGPPNPAFGQPQQNQPFPWRNNKGKNRNKNKKNQAPPKGRQN